MASVGPVRRTMGAMLVVATLAQACAAAPAPSDPDPSTRQRTFVPLPSASVLPSPSGEATAAPTAGSVARLASAGRFAVVSVDYRTITVLAASGDHLTTIASPDRDTGFLFPAWSPDGTALATITVGESRRSVGVIDLPAPIETVPTIRTLVQTDGLQPFYLSWRPDGGAITFLASDADGLTLRIVSVAGAAGDEVIRAGDPFYFDWISADRLFAHVGEGPDAFLGELASTPDPDSDDLPDVPGAFRSPAVSRDGGLLAFVRGTDPSEIVLVERSGTERATAPVVGPAAMTFDPAGDRLATIGADGPPGEVLPVGPLRLLAAGQEGPRRLLEGEVLGFWWSPDGASIATLRVDRTGAAPVWWFAIVDVETGVARGEREVVPQDAFIGNVVGYFDQYATSHALWSPDGATFALPVVVDRVGVVEAVDREGAVVATLPGSFGVWGP